MSRAFSRTRAPAAAAALSHFSGTLTRTLIAPSTPGSRVASVSRTRSCADCSSRLSTFPSIQPTTGRSIALWPTSADLVQTVPEPAAKASGISTSACRR
jgi:hypothetical protein